MVDWQFTQSLPHIFTYDYAAIIMWLNISQYWILLNFYLPCMQCTDITIDQAFSTCQSI